MSYELEIKPLQGNVTTGELMTLARKMIAESRFARLGVDTDKLFFHASDILANEKSLAFGAFSFGVLSGMAIGVCGEVLPFTSSIVATEHYLYVVPEHRGGSAAPALVNCFIQEAKRRGARDVVLSNGFGGDAAKAERLFERCGLTRVGSIFTLGD
jgi:GNAT superfamily N-acetyltransferase